MSLSLANLSGLWHSKNISSPTLAFLTDKILFLLNLHSFLVAFAKRFFDKFFLREMATYSKRSSSRSCFKLASVAMPASITIVRGS